MFSAEKLDTGVIQLSGELHPSNISEFQQVKKLIDPATTVVLDFSGITRISDRAVLEILYFAATDWGRRVRFTGLSDELYASFQQKYAHMYGVELEKVQKTA